VQTPAGGGRCNAYLHVYHPSIEPVLELHELPGVTHCLVCVSAAADAVDELNTLDEDADVDGVDCFIAASNI
jgi:hypothetical protein